MNQPHPIPYQGSKRKLTPTILALFPKTPRLLIEPFAGSAAVSIGALSLGKVNKVHLNDLNEPLVKLWDMIVNHPVEIIEQYRNLWMLQIGQEHAFYDLIRRRFNLENRPADFLYLLARCVKASIRYNTLGEFNQSPDNRRRGMHPDVMKGHILRTSSLMKGKVFFPQ